MAFTDLCNNRVWEHTYNVNIDSLKAGQNTQSIQYILMAVKRKKVLVEALLYITTKNPNTLTKLKNDRPCNSISSRA